MWQTSKFYDFQYATTWLTVASLPVEIVFAAVYVCVGHFYAAVLQFRQRPDHVVRGGQDGRQLSGVHEQLHQPDPLRVPVRQLSQGFLPSDGLLCGRGRRRRGRLQRVAEDGAAGADQRERRSQDIVAGDRCGGGQEDAARRRGDGGERCDYAADRSLTWEQDPPMKTRSAYRTLQQIQSTPCRDVNRRGQSSGGAGWSLPWKTLSPNEVKSVIDYELDEALSTSKSAPECARTCNFETKILSFFSGQGTSSIIAFSMLVLFAPFGLRPPNLKS